MHVAVQILHHLFIGIDNFAHVLWTHLGLHPCRVAGNESLCLELVGIQEIPDEGFRIVGLVGDIRDNKDPGLVREALDPGRR